MASIQFGIYFVFRLISNPELAEPLCCLFTVCLFSLCGEQSRKRKLAICLLVLVGVVITAVALYFITGTVFSETS